MARALRMPQVVVGGLLVLGFLVLALGAPWIAPGDPNAMHLEDQFQPPGVHHLAGTDNFGRDVFTRLVRGARLSLGVRLLAVAISMAGGTIVGMVSGYYGGWVDMAAQRLIDVMLAFPGLLLALALVAVLGPGLINVMIAVGISGIPAYARLVRGEVLSVKSRDYVTAARGMGAPAGHIMLRHLLPNIASRVIVVATLSIAGAILDTAALSYLGLGAQPPTPAWGTMLADGQRYISEAWWLPTAPGVLIALTVLGFNLLGDGLRDLTDPAGRSQPTVWSAADRRGSQRKDAVGG